MLSRAVNTSFLFCFAQQVLVLGCTPDLALTEAALRSAADASLPAACSRTVHLVDACRCCSRHVITLRLLTLGQRDPTSA